MNLILLLGILFMIFHKYICENVNFTKVPAPKAGFGEFIINTQSKKDCNITEQIDDKLLNFTKIIFPKSSESDEFYIVMNLQKKFKLIKVYTEVELLKYGKFVKMFEQTANNPCVHVIGRRLIIPESITNITQCILKPGNYTSPTLHPNDLMHQFFGNKFFYGLCKGKLIYYTEKGIGFCIMMSWVSRPKHQKNKH